ncbi:hypothetical protein QR680_012601 [Steinernema hermaphroditum]|uniref:Putative nuclease HARBI1 n=1 Tax=Steinernema hermaphroditum TaxID=289476 RepID=A0AA39I441_9BILA|nr:hypothetical protein QR680_012601 [Steinernema hermaphroditum]
MEDLDLDLLEHFITEEQAPTFSRRIFRDRTNPLEVSNDIVFRSLFRFRRHVFTALLDELCEDFEHTAPQNCALLPAQQLGAALTVLGGNTFQSHAAAGLQVSQPTVSRCLERVVDAIIKKMNLFVKWPSENEARHISQRFFQTTGIPNIIGAIDGTHCRIQAPVDREYEYVNRKQFHSINCMVIAIPNLIAIGFSAKYPGRSHDSRIFKDSVIYEDFVHRRKKGVLLGDSAYGAERFLLKPILRPASDAERRYTEAVCRGRVVVENFFGVLKRQFHILHAEMRYSPPKACKIITACICLRNFGARCNEPDFEEAIPYHICGEKP